MKYTKLSKHHQIAAEKLVDTIYLLQILYDILDGEGKTSTLLNVIRKNVKYVFHEIEKCREVL